tara:strand:+ start:213 stop:569 length:357 start_codon:yes stop_codon:yes gene_type:complete
MAIKKIKQPYSFNERGELKNIVESKMYLLFQKLEQGVNLTRAEKNEIFHALQQNTGGVNYRLLGMIIPFGQFLTKFLVKYNYENVWREVFAFDKTCIRSSYYTNSRIVEIKEFVKVTK